MCHSFVEDLKAMPENGSLGVLITCLDRSAYVSYVAVTACSGCGYPILHKPVRIIAVIKSSDSVNPVE
uniref:Flavin_Reduct domain-containing protein n=1 Tax=Angiostrongylus cantonensis TaxID=6313 RepID=A0A0K0CZD1_ANGCA